MPIETETFHGSPLGVNLDKTSHEIDARMARYIQDFLVDQEGILRQRGPVKQATGVVAPAPMGDSRTYGIVGGYRTDNTFRIGIVLGDSSSTELVFLSDDLTTTVGTFTFPHAYGLSDPYPIVDVKPALGGQTLITLSDKYGLGTTKRSVWLWRGAGKSNYATGTFTSTAASTTVTGSGTVWSTNVEPGMFLLGYISGSGTSTLYRLIGVVKSVTSNTVLELETGAMFGFSAGSQYVLTSLRGLNPRYGRGRMTATAGQQPAYGGDTKWAEAGLDNTYDVYRARDMKFIGNLLSVTSNTVLNFTTTAAISLSNERYVIVKRSYPYLAGTPMFGFLHSVWNGYQFYANQNALSNEVSQVSRVFFAEQTDAEAVDQSKDDGSYFDISSTKASATEIRGLMASQSALLIFKEDETYGLFGTTSDTWTPRRLADDGCLSNHTVWAYQGSAIWAGKRGIYIYDGVETQNITENSLGSFYADALRAVNHEASRAWAMVSNGHYFLHLQSAAPSRGITKGNTTSTPTSLTIVLNLHTMAITFFTNLHIRGAITSPAETGKGTLYVCEINSGGVRRPMMGAADDLFNATGLDSATCWGATAGPDIYYEWFKFDAGDPQRKKLFKQVQIHHISDSGKIKLDIIPDLNETATTSVSTFGPNATWLNKRIKFLKRSAFLAFRLYADPTDIPDNVKFGPWAIGFKRQRVGRT
jgi:hypothetical protein